MFLAGLALHYHWANHIVGVRDATAALLRAVRLLRSTEGFLRPLRLLSRQGASALKDLHDLVKGRPAQHSIPQKFSTRCEDIKGIATCCKRRT
jgi:hypothetical protein